MIVTNIMAALLWILGILLGLLLLWILVLAVSVLFVNPDSEYDKNSPYFRFHLNCATFLVVKLFGVKIRVEGLEKLPKEGRFLLVGNHRSSFDPILTWYVLRKQDLAFVSKPENFRIPLFGRVIQKCCFLPIDRENPRNAIRTINKAAKLLKKDRVSVGIYPEGTRSKDCTLLPFHNGVFKIAQKAQVPIVVVAVSGTENIHKNCFRRKTPVTLAFVDVLDTEAVQESRTADIGARVRWDLEEALTIDSQ